MKLSILIAAIGMLLAAPAIAQTATAPATEYTVRPGDIIRIAVWPETKYSGEYPVEVTGKVYLPDAGELDAAGLRLSELRAELRRRYGLLMNEPVISITPQFRVSVVGGVSSPGMYVIDPTLNLMDVIARAGGFTRNAKRREVEIIRSGTVLTYDAEEIRATGTSGMLTLQSGDRIVVPERRNVSLQSIMTGLQLFATLYVIYNQVK